MTTAPILWPLYQGVELDVPTANSIRPAMRFEWSDGSLPGGRAENRRRLAFMRKKAD